MREGRMRRVQSPRSLGDYTRIRSWGSRFLVVVGHEDPDLERVVERHETWLLVDTLEPVRS